MNSTDLEKMSQLSIGKSEDFEVEKVYENSAIGKGKTVLVVDDDIDILPLISELLESVSFTPITTESSKKAIALLNDGVLPDILLTDINMPFMDGFELAEKLKAIKPNIGVVYMSGYSSSYYRSYDVEVKAQLLKKPFKLLELVAALVNAPVLTV